MNGPFLKPMPLAMTFDQYCGMRLMQIAFQSVMDAFAPEDDGEEVRSIFPRQFPDILLNTKKAVN